MEVVWGGSDFVGMVVLWGGEAIAIVDGGGGGVLWRVRVRLRGDRLCEVLWGAGKVAGCCGAVLWGGEAIALVDGGGGGGGAVRWCCGAVR